LCLDTGNDNDTVVLGSSDSDEAIFFGPASLNGGAGAADSLNYQFAEFLDSPPVITNFETIVA
jgi:hypothetical protein